MPKYSSDFIRKVSDANDIVDIISQYVPLKQRGNTFSACCPFHKEKTPSFSVSRDKQLFHCFGCGIGGDVYKFIMEKENMDFGSAVKFLADRAGIPIPSTFDQKKDDAAEKHRKRLIKINESAANFYYKNLKTDSRALSYLKQRGISTNEIKTFGLGLAPSNWTSIIEYLTGLGYTIDEILETGLAIKNRDGTSQYDRFRNRIVFPIQNVMDKVIGFGARKIEEDDMGPKYLNSPESQLFKKGGELYNLNRAKRALRDNPLILVEGYMDVIALNKYGFENVAAALGTAFTDLHLKLISRYTKDIVLCFDGDSAGEKATLRALEVLGQDNKLNVKIVRLPEQHDPDSFIRENSTEAFKSLLNNSLPIVDFRISLFKRDNNLNSSEGLINFVNESLTIIKGLNPVERDYYTKMISQISGLDEMAIKDQLNNTQVKISKPQIDQTPRVKKVKNGKRIPRELKEAQIAFLLFAYENPNIITQSEITVDMMTSPFFKWFFLKLEKSKECEPDILKTMTEEERSHFEKGVVRILIKERENVDTTDKTLLEKSIKAIKKYNRQIKIDKLSSQESLLVTGDEQKSGLFNSIINLKKVDF